MLRRINLKEIIKGCVLSALPLIILIVGYSIGSDEDSIWIALAVTQLGLAILWVVIRLGAFSTMGFGARKYSRSFATMREKKYEHEPTYKKVNRKDLPKSANEIVDENINKSWQGIILSLSVGIIELIASLILAFA